jgi:hypothetical protein
MVGIKKSIIQNIRTQAGGETSSASASSAILSNSLKLTFTTFLAEALLEFWSEGGTILEDVLVGIFNLIL